MKKPYNAKNVIDTTFGTVEVFKIDCNSNGHPRYVVHFLDMLSLEREKPNSIYTSELDFNLKAFNSVGLSKYRGKWFGGGLVFTSWNVQESLETMFEQINA